MPIISVRDIGNNRWKKKAKKTKQKQNKTKKNKKKTEKNQGSGWETKAES